MTDSNRLRLIFVTLFVTVLLLVLRDRRSRRNRCQVAGHDALPFKNVKSKIPKNAVLLLPDEGVQIAAVC